MLTGARSRGERATVTDAGYIFAGYAATTAILGVYATWIIRRRRALSRLMAPGEK